MKILIIAFITLFAVIDLVAIFGPNVRKIYKNYKDKKARERRQKAFKEKMKSLEIK